uniref:GRIP and coiled coil domain containing protein n=2 Tax=Echinococcus granulosus TaxID=6210 RepID=A0A068WHM2_ECHGR|nr:GRIP and coiled coil domain containing protein [Echinococcus granulosus]
MSTVSADECYSNVDSLEELRRICGERDATINKLKILLVRKNKTIASLEEEVSYLKTANQMVDQQTGETTSEVAKLKSILSRQQIDLEQSKMEVETLSKMSSDLQRSFAAVKQERDTFKSEVSRLMNDLVTANAQTTELYAIASKCSPLPNNFLTHSHNQHAFILATFKNLAEGNNKSNPDLPILHVLRSIQLEMDRLRGIKGADSLVVSSPGELLPLLEGFSTYLKQCSPDRLRLSLRVHEDKIRSYFTDISRSHNEVTSLLKDFTRFFNSSVQLILSTVNKLDSHSPRHVKTDLLHKEFSVLKGDLDSIKDAMMLHMSSFVENTSALRKQITSALISKSLPTQTHHSPTVDDMISHNFKFRSILSVVSSLQNDLTEVKTTVSQWLTSLQAQIHDIQHFHGKLISEISQRSPPPPPYSECINVPNSSTLEALLTDVWQLKDSLSGVRYSLTEEFLSLQKHVKGIELIRRKLMCQLHNKVTKLRSDATDIRREMHELVSSSNHQITAITTYVHSIENMRLKGFEEVQRQRFKDYDRLVRDKESEIGQLRESCDRLSDECDRFGAMREALRQLILTSATSSVSLSGLSTEDATLVTDLSSHLNRSQATQLELVEQTQAIASLQSDLAAKTAALDAAVVRATEAETSAAESAAEASGLQEKLNLVKRLLVRVRKDASETEKRALRVVEMEAKVTELTQALDKSQCHEEAAQAKLAEVMAERERLVGKVASLQKQYESYKVKALLALRNGKEHPEEGNITGDSSSGTGTEGIGGGASTPLSWRYECSSLVQTEVVRLKERVRELEALLGQTTARLNSALIDLEAANFALAEEREKCSRVSHNLESERAQWREEQEELNTRWRSETATRVAELTTALDAARQESIQALSTQAEEFNTAFGAKIAELQFQLDTAEAKVEAQRLELLEQAKIVQLTAQPPNSQTSQEHLCSRCGRCLSNGGSGGSGDFGDNVTSLRGHHTRPLEEALFGDDKMVSVDIQEAERQTSEMRKTVQSLRSQLANERRNLEYTKSLLVDSEATVERLSAQATILKAEIRRHERNAERERHLGDHNTNSDDTSNSLDAAPAGETRTEYLKNVLLRFLCADPSLGGGGASGASERNALVPVLATLLALSPTERAALQQVAETGLLRASTVTAEDGASGEEGSSWSSFLPSWLGG